MNILIMSESFIVKDSLSHLFDDIFQNANIETPLKLDDLCEFDIYKIDFVVVDINKDNIDIVKYLSNVKKIHENLKIIILDFKKSRDLFSKIIKLAIDGYILNIADKDEFVYIVKRIVSGKKYYDSEILQYSMDVKIGNVDTILTNKEREVLTQVCKGLSNKDIAEVLEVTDYTIKKHVSSILSKLNLKNRQDIIINVRDNNALGNIEK